MDIQRTYERWLARTDAQTAAQLKALGQDEAALKDAFFQELRFGTGGLRGVLGPGSNRMNVYTVAHASQGLADYLCAHFAPEARSVAISWDSRLQSDVFARVSAEVFAANGVAVHIFAELTPTPCLSFAVRALDCAAGVMVTASHNPAQYNGYKVYGADGCQITTQAAEEVLRCIRQRDVFDGVRRMPYDEAVRKGLIRTIPESVLTDYLAQVKAQSLLGDDTPIDRGVSIVYTPLNGTGRKPVLRALRESGFDNVHVVKEQELPDGRFPTCPYPNPEIREAMALGIAYAQRLNADLLLATDPDCDRVGAAVRDEAGDMTLISGNEMGMLLLDYICQRRIALGRMPKDAVCVKTIVTADMAERIAAHYGVRTVNVLTGFKFIGEQIGLLEAQGRVDDFILGFEESYGYLSGAYVRDKDAVNGALLICEMYAYYRAQGKSLLTRLQELYRAYGYALNTLHSYAFEGAEGFARMQAIMAGLRADTHVLCGQAVAQCLDYAQGRDGLPPSDVLKYTLTDGSGVVVRPSGTEPKLKVYLSVSGDSREAAHARERALADALSQVMR